ncbi:MAG: acyl-CoA desaturase [Planctomycetia bacterium]
MSIAVESNSPETVVPKTVVPVPLDHAKDVDPSRQDALDIPEASQPVAIEWDYLAVLAVVHAAALLAFLPWFFSWVGVATTIAGHFLFGMLGVTIGYHRLLTHQGFTCQKWFEHVLALLGVCTLQDSPARWVAIHRIHHKESDHQPDPHSPLAGFFWGHVGWLLVKSRDHRNVFCYERYVRDLLRDPFYVALERRRTWFWVYVAHAALITAIGFAIGWFSTGTLAGAGRLAASMLVWGVFVRTVAVLHGTWAVNSVAHVWGSRNYETTDNSRNNWIVALLSHGEGWHNNHHADQRAAAHGHRWWEFDMSWWVIRALEAVGLVRDVVRPRSWR